MFTTSAPYPRASTTSRATTITPPSANSRKSPVLGNDAFASAEVRVRDGDGINYVATRHDGTSTLITFNNVGTATQMTNLMSSTSRTMKETRLAPLCGRSTWARFPCGVPGLREAFVGAVGVIRGRSPVLGRKSSRSFHIENARCKQRGFLPTQRRKQCGFLLV